MLVSITHDDAGRGSVVRDLEFKSEDPGFDPLAGKGGEEQFFCPSESTLVHAGLCLFVCFIA